MPKGLIIIQWDDEVGTKLLAKYPQNLKITSKTLLNIYTNHRLNNTKPNFASLILRDMKVLSFFSGMGKEFIVVSNFIIAFLFSRNETPMAFKELLKKSSAEILDHLADKQYEKQLPKIFKEMCKLA
ncbi:MAG: hypothetical protein HWN66_18245 [Candidatus Helarchaeota archaeon]|nr:hypothetical protein [Candidatus Helarchaeota archaeon]